MHKGGNGSRVLDLWTSSVRQLLPLLLQCRRPTTALSFSGAGARRLPCPSSSVLASDGAAALPVFFGAAVQASDGAATLPFFSGAGVRR